jgi:uncharacterized protein YcgI (DUF1989 family)
LAGGGRETSYRNRTDRSKHRARPQEGVGTNDHSIQERDSWEEIVSSPTLLVDEVVAYNTGRAFPLRKGQVIRIIGRNTVDFVALNANDLRERFDQARTKSNHYKVYVSKGDTLFSKRDNVMLTIVEDTFPGFHDLQKGMCSRKRHEMVFRGEAKRIFADGHTRKPERWEDLPERGCWENLSTALKPWNIEPDDVPAPLNFFSHHSIDAAGNMVREAVDLPGDASVDLRAEMDLVVAVSHCPGGRGLTTRVQIFEG